MKKRILIIPILTLFLGLSVCTFFGNSQTKVDAESLSLPYQSFTNTAVNQAVAIKRDDPVSVDVSTYKFFAIEMQLTPTVANTWGAYSFSLINYSNGNVLSLDSSATVVATATSNGYPLGLKESDYAGSTGNKRVYTDRLNLPTTEQGYFVAQKNANYFSTIKLGFNGTIFFYLPDYTAVNLSDVYGVKIVNRDQNRTVNVFNTYFCEGITKVANSGFVFFGEKLAFDLSTCVATSGNPTIKTITNVTEGYGLSCVSNATSEVVVSFKNQVNVNLSTYKYLALDITITSPNASGYLNIAPKIFDNSRTVTNNLLMTYAKASAAQANDEYHDGLVASDWSSATGGRRINLPSETYARISCLTSLSGVYVPIKADNNYNLVFKGGSTYTTYIYLPDFGIDNFDLNALSLTSTGTSNYVLNQVYLCERVTKVANASKTSSSYYPTGNKLVLPIISAFSSISSLSETNSISVLEKTYYNATVDESIVNGSLSYLIYEDEMGNAKIDITPIPNPGYSASKVTINGIDVDEVTNGVYTSTLTENVTLSAEFEYSYAAEVKELGTNSELKFLFDENKLVHANDYLALDIDFISAQNDTYAFIRVNLIDENNSEIELVVPQGPHSYGNPTNDLELQTGLERIGTDRINNPTSYGSAYSAPNKVIDNTSYLVLSPNVANSLGKFSGTIYIWLGDFLSQDTEISGISLEGHSGNNPKTCSYALNFACFYDESIVMPNEIDLINTSIIARNANFTDSRFSIKSSGHLGETTLTWVSASSATINFSHDTGSLLRTSIVNGETVTLDNSGNYSPISCDTLEIEALYSACEITINQDEHSSLDTLREGGNVILSVHLDNGYKVSTFEINSETVTLNSDNTYTCSLDTDLDVHLTSEICDVNETSNGNGIVSHVIDEISKIVVYTITPNAGYGIKTILLNGNPVSLAEIENNTLTVASYNENLNLTVTFEQYSIVIDPTFSHGTIETEIVSDGNVKITVTPDAGYYVEDFVVNDVSKILNENNSIIMPLNNMLYVEAILQSYEADSFYITSQGEVSTSYSEDNSTVTYTINPTFGYRIDTITLNGEIVLPADGSITTSNDQNNNLTVLFVEMVTIDDIQNGIIEYDLDETNQTVTFIVTPAQGYEIDTVLVNGVEIALVDGQYTIELVEDLHITATFKEIPNEEPEEPIEGDNESESINFLPLTIILSSVGGISIIAAAVILIIKKRRIR